MGTGATTTGVTKTVNLGTGGASGSTTVVNIGSASAGAGGTTVVNTPTVTFANAVTQVGMPQANLTAQLLGLGGATADSFNRLSVNTPALLFNNAGAGIEATFNKTAAGNDAAFAFKTGFSARALIGLLGNDDFSFKVNRRPCHHADAGHGHQLHRHRLPARHPHPLAAGRKRRHRRADPDRHGGEFRHRDGWGANADHRGTTEREFRLGASGGRGVRRSVRAGDHIGPASQYAIPVTPLVHEQRGSGGGSRLRLLGGLCRN